MRFAQIRKTHRDVIILLDEPGLTLHGTAQKDLLRYLRQELEPHHQIIYTTHSPFLVPADNLASVRTVEEVVRRDKRNRPVSEGYKDTRGRAYDGSADQLSDSRSDGLRSYARSDD